MWAEMWRAFCILFAKLIAIFCAIDLGILALLIVADLHRLLTSWRLKKAAAAGMTGELIPQEERKLAEVRPIPRNMRRPAR